HGFPDEPLWAVPGGCDLGVVAQRSLCGAKHLTRLADGVALAHVQHHLHRTLLTGSRGVGGSQGGAKSGNECRGQRHSPSVSGAGDQRCPAPSSFIPAASRSAVRSSENENWTSSRVFTRSERLGAA